MSPFYRLIAPHGPRHGPPNTMPRPKKVPVAETLSLRREQLREEHAVAVREKIQVSQLVNTLENFALGKGNVKLTPARLKAMEMLLDKSLPNLASVKHEIDAKSVTFVFQAFEEPKAPDAE